MMPSCKLTAEAASDWLRPKSLLLRMCPKLLCNAGTILVLALVEGQRTNEEWPWLPRLRISLIEKKKGSVSWWKSAVKRVKV